MSIALVAVLLAAGKPEVELKPSRRMAMLPAGPYPTSVVFTLTVKDAGDEQFYCPRIEWEWEDETRSTEESDCPPFEEATAADHVRRWTKSRDYRRPGTHKVRVRLYKGDKVVKSVETQVDVRGAEYPVPYRE
jgi:hypothetical protein